MIKFKNNMCKLDGNNLTIKILERSLQNFIPDTWEYNIHKVLETISIANHFDKFETISITNHFDNLDDVDITEAQHILKDLMNYEWSAKSPSEPKLQSRSFLNIVSAEPYVTSNLSNDLC